MVPAGRAPTRHRMLGLPLPTDIDPDDLAVTLLATLRRLLAPVRSHRGPRSVITWSQTVIARALGTSAPDTTIRPT
jgi:hypothetical protein